MRRKHVSDTLKRQRQIFHLALHNPDQWEQERYASLSESLHEARERASTAEKEMEENKMVLKRSQQQVHFESVQEDKLWTHDTERLTIYARN